MSANTNPATFAVNLNGIGNVRLDDVSIPHTFPQVSTLENDYLEIEMSGQSAISIIVPTGNYQNRQVIADIITCEYTRAKTGWGEDVVAGYSATEGKFIVKTIKFAVSDVDEEDPLPGDELIRLNNVNPTRNVVYRLMGFNPAGPGTGYLQSHKSDYHDLFYKRQFIYVRSAQLAAGMENDTRLEIDGTSTPPGGANRCIFLIQVDQDGTTGRIIRRWMNNVQAFYEDTLGETFKDFTNVTLELTDSDGVLIDFQNSTGDPRVNKWSLTLRLDDVVPVAVVP